MESLSDISPGLGDILRAAILVEEGAKKVSAEFALEPGCLALALHQNALNWTLQLSVGGSRRASRKADILLEWTLVNGREFSHAALLAAQDIRNRYGLKKYESAWTFEPFPVEETRKLERLIRDSN